MAIVNDNGGMISAGDDEVPTEKDLMFNVCYYDDVWFLLKMKSLLDRMVFGNPGCGSFVDCLLLMIVCRCFEVCDYAGVRLFVFLRDCSLDWNDSCVLKG